MQRVNVFSANIYSHAKTQLNCEKKSKNETKLKL